MRREPAVPPVSRSLARVLAVDVIDPLAEVIEKPDWVHVLPHHMAGVPVEAERVTVFDRLEGGDSRPVIVGNLSGMDLIGEPHATLVEDVENGVPPRGEVGLAGSDHLIGHRREHGDVLPDGGAGETYHRGDSELGCRSCGPFHLFGGAGSDPFGMSISPYPVRH